LEVDFLLKNFVAGVADRFDDMLQTVVLGGAQHCFRVLAFTLRRLRGARAEAAWLALSRHVPHLTQERQAEVEVRKLEEGGVEEVEAMAKEANVATAALDEPSVKGKKRGKKTKGVALNLWDDKEVKERMEHEVRESTTQEKAEQKAKEREATEQKAIEEAKVKAEQEEMEMFEREVRAQQEAREEAEQEAQKRVEKELKAEEERLGREQEARAKEEAERENEERARKENEEMEREKGQDKTATGEESGRNSISNFGGTGWGSSGGPGGGWGLGSWGEKAKSKAPSIKSTFGSAWGSSTFGSLGFGDAARDSQLSPEELKLIDISGEPAKNSSSLFDDWNHVAATPSNLANDPLDTPATEHAGDTNTTHDPPPVLNDQAPSEDQHRVPSPSLATVPTESAKIPTAENTETSTETPLNADADPHGDPIAAKESTAPGTPAVEGTITPDTPAARDATGPDAEEPPTATAEDDWNIPVKVKKGKKKTGGNSGVATPNPDGNEASGAGKKKKKRK